MAIKSELTVGRKQIKALTKKIDDLLKNFINTDKPNAPKQSPKKIAKAKASKKITGKKETFEIYRYRSSFANYNEKQKSHRYSHSDAQNRV